MKKFLLYIVLVTIVAIISFGCSKDNPVGPSSLAGVIVFQDNYYSGGISGGTPGSIHVLVGLFYAICDGTEDILKITLRDDASSPMGVNFQNLVLNNDYGPFGTTKSDLNVSRVGKYVFTINPAMNLAAGAKYNFYVYADIKNSAVVDKAISSLQFYSITTVDRNGKIHEYLNPFAFPFVYIYNPEKG